MLIYHLSNWSNVNQNQTINELTFYIHWYLNNLQLLLQIVHSSSTLLDHFPWLQSRSFCITYPVYPKERITLFLYKYCQIDRKMTINFSLNLPCLSKARMIDLLSNLVAHSVVSMLKISRRMPCLVEIYVRKHQHVLIHIERH